MRGEDQFPNVTATGWNGSPPRAWGRLRVTSPRITPRTVHPHVRGEDTCGGWALSDPSGSPPRAWGRLWRGYPLPSRHRFTPTCVGKTSGWVPSPIRESVHPHVRGEDARSPAVAFICCGSPPRAWGRPNSGDGIEARVRFTPTCVGKTSSSSSARLTRSGSPPRAWGRLLGRCRLGRCLRFTPTCVGKTAVTSSPTSINSVHPHVRGEDAAKLPLPKEGIGSPPRAWGRLGCSHDPRVPRRFTPTCVGKTHPLQRRPLSRPVHPHVRGEDAIDFASDGVQFGSPPRAWGRQQSPWRCGRPSRFTPTCVGKTHGPSRRRRSFSVHPHVRGEDTAPGSTICTRSGSPPRAWGRPRG